jgi:cation:H+ antiporter
MLMALHIIGGLLLLVAGGEGLVRGAVSIAKKLGVPVIIIGLTIVSLGTSAPEMVISVMATLDGKPDIAIGNVIGSNIANILLILGLTALVYPVATDPAVIKRDGILMMLATVLLVVFAEGGMVGRTEGMILLAITVGYLFSLFYRSRQKSESPMLEDFEEETSFDYDIFTAIILVVGGLAALVFGAEFMVEGASELARMFGASEGVIGVTIVAIGTSAPELVTCLVAAYRRHSDIAVGNVVGSNFFNITAVLGVASTTSPMAVSEEFLNIDIWVMVITSTLLIPLMLSDKKVTRTEGGMMVLWYAGYLYYQYTKIGGA